MLMLLAYYFARDIAMIALCRHMLYAAARHAFADTRELRYASYVITPCHYCFRLRCCHAITANVMVYHDTPVTP